MAKKHGKKPEVETTGHEWDGIQELNNPLPRWWVWVFYLCVAWGVWYTIAYPAWPMLSGATPGYKHWSSRGQVAEEIAKADQANAAINAKLASASLDQIEKTPELDQYAVSAGAAVFRTWCAQCHGSGAAGNKGFPNLLDDDWLWGGTIDDIHYTISHGIRNENDPDARYSQMPAWGDVLEPGEIEQVVNYVLSLTPNNNPPKDPSMVGAGQQIFMDNCAACHGEDAKGMQAVGAPNLTDAIWLYGGNYATVKETVTNSRFGVMPNWSARLSESEVRAVATYVHQLGGGQ